MPRQKEGTEVHTSRVILIVFSAGNTETKLLLATTKLDLIDLIDTFLYVSEKKYSDKGSATRKRIIRKKAEKFVIVDGEVYYKAGREKQVN